MPEPTDLDPLNSNPLNADPLGTSALNDSTTNYTDTYGPDAFAQDLGGATAQEFGGYGDSAPDGQGREAEEESDTGASSDFWLTDSIEGVGLGVAAAIEGILELPSIIPGIDYDIPDNFGMGHAETGMGRFVEGTVSFFAPFLAPTGWIAAGATLGKGASAVQLVSKTGRIAKAAGAIQGGTWKLGRHIAKDKLHLTKFTNEYLGVNFMKHRKMLNEGATGFGKARGMAYGFGAKVAGQFPEMMGAGIGGAIADFAVWDPHEDRLSNFIQEVPGLANPVNEFLAADAEDSELLGRIKQTIEGFGMGFVVDSFIGGIKGLGAAHRVFKSTGDSAAAAKAFRMEKIENDVARWMAQYGDSRDDTINRRMLNLGLDPERLSWDTISEDIERELFQGATRASQEIGPMYIPENLRGLITDDDYRLLNGVAMREVSHLVGSFLDGGLDPKSLETLAFAGQSVRGEYDRMGQNILPALFGNATAMGGRADDGMLWTALNAVLSPNQQVDTHTGASMMVLAAWRAAGRPKDKGTLQTLVTDAMNATGADSKSLEGMKEHQLKVIELLSNVDDLKSESAILDYVSKKLIKTREFAGGFLPGWMSGIALDVHMGHLLDWKVWKNAPALYSKKAGGYEGVGATAYRALIRKTAQDMGWGSGTEVQEASWSAITAIKGLLSHFRGNVDDVMDNMHGELVTQLWDHNVVLKELIDKNPQFSALLEQGGASKATIDQMRKGTGVFAPRKVQPGVPAFDREQMRKVINNVQKFTSAGTGSGTPGRMLRMIRELGVDSLARLGINAPGQSYAAFRGAGVSVTKIRDSAGKLYELSKTQASAKMRKVFYHEEVHGLPDTFRLESGTPGSARPLLRRPSKEEVAEATTKVGEVRVIGATVEDGKNVSVVLDQSNATVVRTKGGGTPLATQDVVTLTNVTFDVSGKRPLVKGAFSNEAGSATGVPVRFDGKFFVTENGYAIKGADSITMAGDQAFVRGDVTYWDTEAAFGVVKGEYRKMKLKGDKNFSHVVASKLDAKNETALRKLPKAEQAKYVKGFDGAGNAYYYKEASIEHRPAGVIKGLEGQPKTMGIVEGGPPIGVSIADQGPTKMLFQGGEESVENARGVTLIDRAGNLFMNGMKNPDPSTGLHELMHAWRLISTNRTLTESDRVAMGGLRDFEIDVLEQTLGVKPGAEWTTDQDELLAGFWEKYIYEGVLPVRDAFFSDLDFDVLTVAFAKISKQQRKVYEQTEGLLPTEDIPQALRELFDGAVARSNVAETLEALGSEARAMYNAPLSSGSRVTRTLVEQDLDKFEAQLAIDVPGYKPGLAFKDDNTLKADPVYQALSTGDKIKLGRRRAAWKRQQDAINTPVEGVITRAEHLSRAQVLVKSIHEELDIKYADGWTDADLTAGELKRMQAARANLSQVESGRVPFASRGAEPERSGGRDVPDTGFGSARRDESRRLPVNTNRTVRMEGEGGLENMADGDDAKDIFEQYVKEEEDYLNPELGGVKEADAAWIVENEKRYYKNLAAAARRGGKADVERLFDLNTADGRRFTARSRAIRSFSADVFASVQETEVRLAAAEAAGNLDEIAKEQSELLYWVGLFEPITAQLMSMSQIKGSGLADMATEPWGQVMGRPATPETIKAAIEATSKALKATRGEGETVETYIARMRVAMREGELSLISVATGNGGDKMDAVLEVFYNSLLSGPRTHAVNTLSNTIYGLMMHGSRQVGRKALRAARLTDDFAGAPRDVKKAVAHVVGLRQVLKDSMAMARIAISEGAAQYDQTGSRAAFDSARGVFSGKTSRDYVTRMGLGESMPQPLKGLLNATVNVVSVGGWPTRLLGGMDDMFKQIHSRVIVTEEITKRALKAHPDDANAMAEYIVREFETIIGEGNHFTLKRVKRDGYKEATAKGLNKSEARRYMNDYVKKNWTDDKQAMANKALEFSRRSTFTLPNNAMNGRNAVSSEIHNLGKVLQDMTGQVRWLRFLMPFINTPTNLMAEAADMLVSPIVDGVIPGAKRLKSLVSGDIKAFKEISDPEETADALGRLAMSSSIISLVWMKVNAGEITGGGPKDPAAQKILREAGWQPYSIRFGDSYFGYGRLDPVASVVGIIADIGEGFNGNPYTDDPEEEGIKALMMGATMALFRNLGEKSYLSGMINFASAIDNPEYYGKHVAFNLAGAAVPNLSAQIAGQMDPTMREVRGITDKWKTRIPFLGDDLLPKRNFMGEPLGKMQHLGGPQLGLFSPIPHSQVSSDPIATEAAKYGEIMGAPEPIKFGTLDLREYGAYDRYQELQGEVTLKGRTMRTELERLIDSGKYQALPDFAEDGASSPKMDVLRKTVTKYRTQAWKELLKEFPQLKENFNISMYNRAARTASRPERDLLALIK